MAFCVLLFSSSLCYSYLRKNYNKHLLNLQNKYRKCFKLFEKQYQTISQFPENNRSIDKNGQTVTQSSRIAESVAPNQSATISLKPNFA